MTGRMCSARTPAGEPCRATPRRDVPFCFVHDPESALAAAEARRLGGQRRRKETTLALAYDVTGLRTDEEIERLLTVAAMDALALPNSPARLRVLIETARIALKLRESVQLEARVAALEAGARRAEIVDSQRTAPAKSLFEDASKFEEENR